MSINLTLNRNICVSILLLIFNCIEISRTNIPGCETNHDRNRPPNVKLGAKELCSQDQSFRHNGTTPTILMNLTDCVPWTSDLMTSVLQESFPPGTPQDHNRSLESITDSNLSTCATTDYDMSAYIGVTLKSQFPIYAVRITTELCKYVKLRKYPRVYVEQAGGKKMYCNIRKIPQGNQVFDVYCPRGTVGDKIIIYDVKPERSYFLICGLKIYLAEGSHKRPETTTPASGSNDAPRSSTEMPSTLTIIIAVLCCLVLLVITFLIVRIIHVRKKSFSKKVKHDVKTERVEINEVYEADDVHQQDADNQPEYHIYNTVGYEEIGPRPDLLESCDNIYSEPDEPKTPILLSDLLDSTIRFRENEVYTNPDSQDTVNKTTDCVLKIKHEQSVDSKAVPTLSSDLQDSLTKWEKLVDSDTRFRENEVYTNPYSEVMVKDNSDYYGVAGKSNMSSQ